MDNKLEITQEAVAINLLWPLWRCIDDDYKSKYKREIWDHFENAVRSAAYTGKLRTYLTNFKSRIPMNLEVQYAKQIQSIVESGKDYEILNWLRDETTYIVMMVRLQNQERNELFK